jgi:VanZ family protein
MTQVSRPYLLLLVAYCLLMLAISILADLGSGAWVFSVAAQIPYGDKLAHMILAAILSFLLNSALRCRVTSLLRVKILTGSLIAYFLILIEEVSQLWMITRRVDIYDVLAAFAGAYLFGLVASRNLKTKTEKQLA